MGNKLDKEGRYEETQNPSDDDQRKGGSIRARKKSSNTSIVKTKGGNSMRRRTVRRKSSAKEPSSDRKLESARQRKGGNSLREKTKNIDQRSKLLTLKNQETATKLIEFILEKGVNGIQEEFGQLKIETIPKPEEYSCFSAPENVDRNRYKDVPCGDATRVKLVGGANDYIHANYCPTAVHPKRFICSQGPLDKTVHDFWSMVMAEKCEYIVMLCNFEELGKQKCAVYFPLEANTMMNVETISISCLSVNRLQAPQALVIRKLRVVRGDEMREVEHIHWEAWPDRSVPLADATPTKLLERVCASRHPVLVHCSAGIGRTGSIVAIQMVLDLIGCGKTLETGLAPVLRELRRHRMFSVQTEQQYLFIHRILLDHYMRNQTKNDPKVQQFIDEYTKAVGL